MKKYLALVMALAMMAICFAACGSVAAKDEATEPVSITEVKETAKKTEAKKTDSNTKKPETPTKKTEMTVEDLNKKFGCKLAHPGVMGVSDEFCTIENGNIAEYNFILNGYPYCWRYAKSEKDISGIKTSEGTAFQKASKDTKYVSADGWKLYRWFDGNGGQYVFMVEDQGKISEDQFVSVAQEMEALTK